ncbi:MAG: DUF4416 family protein [Chitinivibrionales bacterium]
MGTAGKPLKTKLFLAIMFQPRANIMEIMDKLNNAYGPVEYSYGPIEFSFTKYYEEEMGNGLLKIYMSFAGLIDREVLPDIKVFTNILEREHLADGRRTINLDPGYIAQDKLVLATTKDFYQRLYLAHGIYGEVTLHFRKGRFRYFSWTYPDYNDPPFLKFLTKARAKLVKELRKESTVDPRYESLN